MQAFGEFIASLKGEIYARNKDPILGTFAITWATTNWDKLSILVWGSKPTDVRVQEMVASLSISNVTTDYRLLIVPLIASVIFLFFLPWVSLWARSLQAMAIERQNTHSVELDVRKVNEQKKLRKAVLRANPEKEFLAEDVKMDLHQERERNYRRSLIKEYIQSKADAAQSEAISQKSRAEITKIDLERERQKKDIETTRFDKESAFLKEALASSRFPAVYQLMQELSKSVNEDGITLSLECLSQIIATLFGYPNPKEMLDDREFNQESITKLKYLYVDMAHIVKEFDIITEDQHGLNEDVTGQFLFEHLQAALADYEFELMSGEALAQDIAERVSINSFDLLQSDELSGPMAETDTIFDEIELGLDYFEFSTSFIVTLIGSASGSHRKESAMQGQGLDVTVVAKCIPKLGKFGLSDYILEIAGSPEDFR